MSRMGKFERITKETDISVEVDFNSTEFEINTPIPFFSHMLETFAKHSNIGIKLIAKGDIEVDEHHTVEDTAIALGNAFRDALSDKKGIERFGHAIVPMDESVAICGVDISGRGVFRFEGEIEGEVKGLKAENFLHFLETFSRESGINIYLSISGKNMHHMFEAGFKALAVSIRNAIKIAGEETRSTKGVLD